MTDCDLGNDDDDDVLDGVTTLPCRLTARDTSPLRNSHRYTSDTAVYSTDDDLRSTNDLQRRRSGFHRRRLGHLQLKHRLAVDLPEVHCCPAATRVSDQELSVDDRRVSDRQNETIVDSLWNSLDDCECQLLVIFAVAVATLAAALNAPPVWLIFVVAGLSLIHFIIHERRRANSQSSIHSSTAAIEPDMCHV